MTAKEAKALARDELSKKRFHHVENVVKAAKTLARTFGADVEKAELAAWLHDLVKERTRGEILQILGEDAIIQQSVEGRPEAVWHGPAAAVYAKNHLGVDDGEVLSAVAWHTTGRPDMPLLDKVLYLADYISDERDFDGVDEVRALAKTDLDAAVDAAMRQNLLYLEEHGKPVDDATRAALSL